MSIFTRRYEGVTAFTGMFGSGKTYALAEMAARAMARGETVYSNAGFDIEGTTPIETLMDFARIKGPALVCWDELPVYFSARRWMDFPDGFFYKLTQIRHDGIRLMYSAVHENMVDVHLRQITAWYWHCNAITGGLLRRRKYPPQEWRKQQSKPWASEFVIVRKRITELYDTHGKVAVPEANALRFGTLGDDAWTRPAWADAGGEGSTGGSRLRVPGDPSPGGPSAGEDAGRHEG